MKPVRLISRLDIKKPNLIKGIHLEGLRVVGDPWLYANQYYNEGIDEIIYMDAVASLYERNTILELISQTAREIFVPITVGGGIRSLSDAIAVLRAGADKIAINTAAIENPNLFETLAKEFGSQCVVASIEAKKESGGKWEALVENGREKTGKDVLTWALECEERGVGEILVTSVDREGTFSGFDVELALAIKNTVSIPGIASGGCGTLNDIEDVILKGNVDGIVIAGAFHYGKIGIQEIRDYSRKNNLPLRIIR